MSAVTEFEAEVGHGVRARMSEQRVVVGSAKLMADEGIEIGALAQEQERLENETKTAVVVGVDGKAVGVIAVADQVKEDSAQAIAALKRLGLETIMVTGDNERTAEAIALTVGIDRVVARVLPAEKLERIRELQSEGRTVAMVGDGINDAAALKQANVGIAIGTGTDIAIEAGDVILVRGELGGVVKAIELSRSTFRKIRQNLFWAYFYNMIAIPVAMLGFLHPVIAEAAMAFSSVTVVANSNSLKRLRFPSL